MAKQEISEDGVVDKVAFKQYNLLRNSKLMTHTDYELSDGETISMTLWPHHFRNKIKHLPKIEQERLLDIKKKYATLSSRCGVLKRKAYDTQRGGRSLLDLLVDRKGDLIDLFGRLFNVHEVTKIVNEEWGIQVKKEHIDKFRIKYATDITIKQEQFKTSYSDVRLFVKRSRLEELIWLYGQRKEKYKLSNSREDYKLLLGTLEQIRKESEGEQININQTVNINADIEIHNHLRTQVFKDLVIKEIVLGRLASRMGIRVADLIESLHNSYYAKLNGYSTEDIDHVEMPLFPSQQTYDFAKIDVVNKRREAEDASKAKPTELVNPNATNIKKAFLEKLKEKSNKLKKNLNTATAFYEVKNSQTKNKDGNES